ncbi:glycoside hydrolase family 88 protein [Parapedobacter koreensis]|uniref:Unsaturated chondroitin disaccharide hydrolase n=1 Tax=Parapedobacter koreensis TaxID=332977 RepID=A0A1H7JTL3_9SPHI|nr:glycoside hydrolase family 88 protein [Parapedobacter koreensis]SEK77646.1 unsaturated chondroitin disaccharide hydrolase [Parapedobacter koreensis]
MKLLFKLIPPLALILSCQNEQQYDVQHEIDYSVAKVRQTLALLPPDPPNIPRNITEDGKTWRYVSHSDWTSGFWPGILWYAYEATRDETLLKTADIFTKQLLPLSQEPATDHDLGFQVFNSFGNGYRLTSNEAYKPVILATADSLATLYNPRVGTILSWPRSVPNLEWPQHNTIIDNMINLELLFWASKNGGADSLYDIAVKHAEVTMANQFRPDHTVYHVVVYDKDTGKRIKQVTHQGFADQSVWARGQAWAIYGFTMVYRETHDPKFLDFAQQVTDVYLDRLPDDLVPYWDFDDPDIPDAPRDASAAAIVASALLELCTFVEGPEKDTYFDCAQAMLRSLFDHYRVDMPGNTALLKGVTGHKPNGSEINTSINYGDYYYLEALLRLHKLSGGPK